MFKLIGTIGFFLSLMGVGITIEKDVLAPARYLDKLEDLYSKAQNTVATKMTQTLFDQTASNFYDTGILMISQNEFDQLNRHIYDFENFITAQT